MEMEVLFYCKHVSIFSALAIIPYGIQDGRPVWNLLTGRDACATTNNDIMKIKANKGGNSDEENQVCDNARRDQQSRGPA